MARYAFDIETNGLLDDLTKVHSLVLIDVDTGDMQSFGPPDAGEGARELMRAEQLIGHNVIKFDIPALKKVFPWFNVDPAKVFDTLVVSRLIWSDLGALDDKKTAKGLIPASIRGSHSLKAWGHRLGELKGDFGETSDWSEWTPEMQAYCEQDVRVTRSLFNLITSKNYSQTAIDLEHRVAWIVAEQERHGFLFDERKAMFLLSQLMAEKADVESKLQSLFDPWFSYDGLVTPKRTVTYKSVEKHSTWEGADYCKVSLTVFNPGSRQHIADRLMKIRGWKPTEFTANGQPKVDEEILEELDYPEAKQITYYLMLSKRIGQLADGKNSWLNLVGKDGRMHGSVVTNGAVTGRMTHSYPNVAQVPSVGKPYGAECRELFCVPKGKKLVGVDVSGLELRMLAHYMNDDDYTREVVDGDVHTANQKAAGLPTRNNAKTFIYAFLYGAGDAKIGKIVGNDPVWTRRAIDSLAIARAKKGLKPKPDEYYLPNTTVEIGRLLKSEFLNQLPSLKHLISTIKKQASTPRWTGQVDRNGKKVMAKFLRGLDGRLLHIRSEHAALNTLLQSAGALVCKRWAVEMDDALIERGWKHRCQVVANIHDEHQYEVDEEIAEEVGKLSVECIKRAGQFFKINCPLTGEYKVGDNWKECH